MLVLWGPLLLEAPWRLDLRPSRSPCFWGHGWALAGHVGAILGLRETYVGQFLGPFLRAKNSIIFSAKKLGLEQPMLGLFWVALGSLGAMLGPSWAYVRPYVGQCLGPSLRAKNSVIFSAKKLGLEWPMLGLFWVALGSLGAMLGPSWAYVRPYVGQCLGPSLRAKNSVIFSAKKLGLEWPMLGLFWVNIAATKPPLWINIFFELEGPRNNKIL